MRRSPAPVPGGPQVPDVTGSASARPGRVVALDNVRALLVAWIIGCHALLAYTAIGGWPYDEVSEVTMSPPVEYALSLVLGPTALFVIGTFFFLAGLFAAVDVDHRGPSRFARARLVRLGLPWVACTLLVWPLFMWFAYTAAGRPVTYWAAFLGRTPFLDSGPLWFAQVLLYVSLGYAAWVAWRPAVPVRTIRGLHLVGVGAVIAAGSFVVRLRFPARSQQVLDLHLWQWPQCVAMFWLGVAVSGQGWLQGVPATLARRCGATVLGTVAGAGLLAFVTGVRDFGHDGVPALGGWSWYALALDVTEAALVVAGSVWLVAWAQRRLRSTRPLAWRCSRGSYAAFVLQVPVLLTLEIVLRPVPLPGFGKGLLVGLLGCAGSFWLAWLLVSRTGLKRVL